jgi:hypothetical protein
MPDIRRLEDLLHKDLSVWYGRDVDKAREDASRDPAALIDSGEQVVPTGS